MKVIVHHREHGKLEFENIDRGRIVLSEWDKDPEYPTRFWLSDIEAVEIEGTGAGHAVPAAGGNRVGRAQPR